MFTTRRTKTEEQPASWITGKINMHETARRLGYKGPSLFTGIRKVKKLLSEMGITVL